MGTENFANLDVARSYTGHWSRCSPLVAAVFMVSLTL